MNVLFDIGHPVDVHLYKNLALNLESKGHKTMWTAREKDITESLLKSYGFDYYMLGKNQDTLSKKIMGILPYEYKLFKKMRKFKPDMVFSIGSFYAAHVCFLLGVPHLTFEDTGNMEQIVLFRPFTKAVFTPSCFTKEVSKHQIYLDAYKENAYLIEPYFKRNSDILKKLKMKETDTFTLVRFVSWDASHDSGHSGISLDNKIKAVKEFSKYGKVVISSENKLPEELEQYKFSLKPHEMHDAMAYASLIYGESATMTTEGALLGVPGIYLDNTSRYYTQDLEKNYGLIFNFSESEADQQKSIEKGVSILKNYNKAEWTAKQKKMLSEKIDFTAFLVWFAENWPESNKIMKENPAYQQNFK